MPGPDGRIGHAELEIGESVLMLADAFPGMGGQTPEDLGGTPVTMMLYVEALTRSSTAPVEQADDRRPVEDQFLWRPGGTNRRSVGPQMVPCDARGGCSARRDGEGAAAAMNG